MKDRSKIKALFLELLDDPDVYKKIKSMWSNSYNKEKLAEKEVESDIVNNNAAIRMNLEKLKKKYNALEEENTALLSKATQLSKVVEEKERDIAELTDENKALKEENAKLFSKSTRISSRLEEKEHDIAELTDENKALKEENAMLFSKLTRISSRLEEKERDIAELTDKNKRCKDELSKLSSENLKLKDTLSENEKTISDLLEKQKIMSETINRFKSVYGDTILCFANYHKLSDDVKQYLCRFVSDKDEIYFISSCTRLENLPRIWDCAKNLYLNKQFEDAELLTEIFTHCFNFYLQSSQTTDYQLDNTRVGERFDDDKHSKGSVDSKSSGNISKVLLQGFFAVNTGKFIRRTLVIV